MVATPINETFLTRPIYYSKFLPAYIEQMKNLQERIKTSVKKHLKVGEIIFNDFKIIMNRGKTKCFAPLLLRHGHKKREDENIFWQAI